MVVINTNVLNPSTYFIPFCIWKYVPFHYDHSWKFYIELSLKCLILHLETVPNAAVKSRSAIYNLLLFMLPVCFWVCCSPLNASCSSPSRFSTSNLSFNYNSRIYGDRHTALKLWQTVSFLFFYIGIITFSLQSFGIIFSIHI